MDECRSAIGWIILPIYRVAESIDAKRDAFDVVVVDEASQGTAPMRFVLDVPRRREIIVVGDDKRINPGQRRYVGPSGSGCVRNI